MENRIDSIRRTLLPVFEGYRDRLVFACLFGSVARRETTPLSDIDIAVFISGPEETYGDTKLSLYADICRALKTNDVDLLVLNSATNLIILEDVVRYGVILYDSVPDLREEFELKILHQAIDFRAQRVAIMGM